MNDIEALFKVYPQTVDEENVRKWMALNGKHFIEDGYLPDEVAYLAIHLAGLDRKAVIAVLGHWSDALTGGRIERRYAMKELQEDFIREEMAQKKSGKVTLLPQWEALADYSNGIDFKEAA